MAAPDPSWFLRGYLKRQEGPRGIESAHLLVFIIQAPLREPVLVIFKPIKPPASPEVGAASPNPPVFFTTPSSLPSQVKIKLAPPLPMLPPASRAGTTIWKRKLEKENKTKHKNQWPAQRRPALLSSPGLPTQHVLPGTFSLLTCMATGFPRTSPSLEPQTSGGRSCSPPRPILPGLVERQRSPSRRSPSRRGPAPSLQLPSSSCSSRSERQFSLSERACSFLGPAPPSSNPDRAGVGGHNEHPRASGQLPLVSPPSSTREPHLSCLHTRHSPTSIPPRRLLKPPLTSVEERCGSKSTHHLLCSKAGRGNGGPPEQPE